MPVGAAQFGQADLSKTKPYTEAPMTQLGRAAALQVQSLQSLLMLGLFHLNFLFWVSTDASRYRPIRTGRFVQDGSPHRNPSDAPRTRRYANENGITNI